jgi:hypothetical protein
MAQKLNIALTKHYIFNKNYLRFSYGEAKDN